jgi:hypothetical protein
MSQTSILSPDELVEITEYRRRADQRRWLDDHGWKYEVGRTGRPKVLRAERDRHMLGGGTRKLKTLNLGTA